MKTRTAAPMAASLMLLTALGGCVQNYPTRESAQGAAPGAVAVRNAPPQARLLVDGRDLGPVSLLAGGAPVVPGRHEVVVTHEGRRLHAQTVVVAAGARAEVVVP